VDVEYLAKYGRALVLMKQLLADDPRSFKQQWRIRLGWLPLALVHTYKHMHVLLYTNVCIMICIHQLYNWSLAFRIGRVCVCVQVLRLLPREDPRQAHRGQHLGAAVLKLERAGRHDHYTTRGMTAPTSLRSRSTSTTIGPTPASQIPKQSG
jgi:hypothetical protein